MNDDQKTMCLAAVCTFCGQMNELTAPVGVENLEVRCSQCGGVLGEADDLDSADASEMDEA